KSSPVIPLRAWRPRGRLLLPAGAIAAVLVGAVASITTLVVLASSTTGLVRGGERMAVRLHNLPPGDEFAEINRVTYWPPDWIAAVCEQPVYHLRTPNERFPHAIVSSICTARVRPDGESADITVARFPAELPMQADLFNSSYKWYAFSYDDGAMVVFATFSEVAAVYDTGFTESVVLQPLKQFGFRIYSRPGP
ncbi:hypothetical protein, partial [Mycobacterium sp. D16R24]|uniref:hypothetical protein n=1 Tax=Mycobacterium sp. D16R24 TaxID=1855656 RepID=UPI001C37DA39